MTATTRASTSPLHAYFTDLVQRSGVVNTTALNDDDNNKNDDIHEYISSKIVLIHDNARGIRCLTKNNNNGGLSFAQQQQQHFRRKSMPTKLPCRWSSGSLESLVCFDHQMATVIDPRRRFYRNSFRDGEHEHYASAAAAAAATGSSSSGRRREQQGGRPSFGRPQRSVSACHLLSSTISSDRSNNKSSVSAPPPQSITKGNSNNNNSIGGGDRWNSWNTNTNIPRTMSRSGSTTSFGHNKSALSDLLEETPSCGSLTSTSSGSISSNSSNCIPRVPSRSYTFTTIMPTTTTTTPTACSVEESLPSLQPKSSCNDCSRAFRKSMSLPSLYMDLPYALEKSSSSNNSDAENDNAGVVDHDDDDDDSFGVGLCIDDDDDFLTTTATTTTTTTDKLYQEVLECMKQ